MESLFSSNTNNVPKISDDEKKECQETYQKYKERISNLPRHDKGGELNDPPLYLYQNFWCNQYFLERIMSAQEHFRAQPSDIILTSSPKTGTTWLKALTIAILTRNLFDDSSNPILTTNPHDCVSFLEIDFVQNQPIKKNLGLPLISTHIPYPSLPESIIESGCKIIYICRDPKDVFVSLWHFLDKLTPKNVEPIPLEKAFELFCEGVFAYGSYWDHVLGYWKASLEKPDKILFLKYEEMKRDTLFNVKALATFMDQKFSEEEEKDGVVEKILWMCSFEHLSNLKANKSEKLRSKVPISVDNNLFFRKGEVGDYMNYLTIEMIEKLDWIMEQKIRGSGLGFSVQSGSAIG